MRFALLTTIVLVTAADSGYARGYYIHTSSGSRYVQTSTPEQDAWADCDASNERARIRARVNDERSRNNAKRKARAENEGLAGAIAIGTFVVVAAIAWYCLSMAGQNIGNGCISFARNKVVYEHLDCNGQVFYVGMGNPERARDTTGRNDHWFAVACNGWSARIVAAGLSKSEALALEAHRIRSRGREGYRLTNIVRPLG